MIFSFLDSVLLPTNNIFLLYDINLRLLDVGCKYFNEVCFDFEKVFIEDNYKKNRYRKA